MSTDVKKEVQKTLLAVTDAIWERGAGIVVALKIVNDNNLAVVGGKVTATWGKVQVSADVKPDSDTEAVAQELVERMLELMK